MKAPAQLRDLADAIEAHGRGEAVQCSGDGKSWNPATPDWDEILLYRPAPKPVTRPWSKPEDVPAFCWLRKLDSKNNMLLITHIDSAGMFCGGNHSRTVLFGDFDCWEYSVDRKTWLPCVVTEEAK